jgi:hypothetical protein
MIRIKPDYEKIKGLLRNYSIASAGVLITATSGPIYTHLSGGKVTDTMLVGSLILGTFGVSLLAKGVGSYFRYKNSFLEVDINKREYKGMSIDSLVEKEGIYYQLNLINSYQKEDYGTIEVKIQGYDKKLSNLYNKFIIPLVKNPTKVIDNVNALS